MPKFLLAFLLFSTSFLFSDVDIEKQGQHHSISKSDEISLEESYRDSQAYTIKHMNGEYEDDLLSADYISKGLNNNKLVFSKKINNALIAINKNYGTDIYNTVNKYLHNSRKRGFDITIEDLETYVKVAYNIKTGNNLQTVNLSY